ncbi:MAG: hypothetical protein WD834_00330 [Actinomycetota bacterium]
MIDERERFERAFQVFEMPEPSFERLIRRRNRKRRNERLAAGIAAFAIVVAVGAIFGRAWFSSEPVVVDEPKPVPEGWVRSDSSLHGYSIGVPSDWILQPAIIPWRWGERPFEDGRGDAWFSPPSTSLNIASQPIPADVTADEWLARGELRRWVEPGVCEVRSTEPIEVDGVIGTLTQNCLADATWWKGNDALEVALITGGRGYTIWFMSRGDIDERRQLFEEILATIDLGPEDAAEIAAGGGWTGIWPQSTEAEAEEAQARADAGDPEATWQLDPNESAAVAIAKRFLRESLGWEGARDTLITSTSLHSGTNWSDVADLNFIRCETDRVNVAYPDAPCAPADGNTFERVAVRLEQLLRPDSTGIWFVTRWAELPGYTQAQPMSDGETRSFVEGSLEARVAGSGAEDFFHPDGGLVDFPLLYGSTGGVAYERFQIVDVGDPLWPYGTREVSIQLFADGGAIVVEQYVIAYPGGDGPWQTSPAELTGQYGPWLTPIWGSPTTEDGEVIDDGLS